MLEQVATRLRAPDHRTSPAAVSDAIRLVLRSYLDEGDIARRYALTSMVSALRDREITGVACYQRVFREYIADQMEGKAAPAPVHAELMAATVVAAHKHILRRWLRSESTDPMGEVEDALRLVAGLFTPAADPEDRTGTTIVAFRTGLDIKALTPALHRITETAPDT